MKTAFLFALAFTFTLPLAPALHASPEVPGGKVEVKFGREVAVQVLEDLRIIDAATDQYAIEFNKPAGSPVTWANLQMYMKKGTRLFNSDGKDPLGNPYTFGTVDKPPQVSRKTMAAFALDAKFWEPFAPK